MLIPKGFEKSYSFIADGQVCKAEYESTSLGTPFYCVNGNQLISGATILKNFKSGKWDCIAEIELKCQK